jgi:hypothetical protein
LQHVKVYPVHAGMTGEGVPEVVHTEIFDARAGAGTNEGNAHLCGGCVRKE